MKYPTIVNNIPKDSNKYDNTMDDYAKIDNNLAGSQRDIGESSNVAQIAQTYACNFNDTKYTDYVCVLSVLAQCAIDNAKRRFDIDLSEEIRRIKNDMDIKENLYPNFWRLIRRDTKLDRINTNLKCPMNYLYDLELNKFRHNTPTLPMSYFFKKFELEKDRRTSKKVEDIIRQYSIGLYEYNVSSKDSSNIESEDYLLLRKDFEDMINDIKKVYLSNTYLGLMSWLIDRAFTISYDVNRNRKLKKQLDTNKALLLKTLYDINCANLLKIFSKNC